jgi:hypothetical protein
MEKERKITAPDGCEIEKVELIDGVAVVTFREKERKLPKTWEEFCEMFPIKKGEAFIDADDQIQEFDYNFVEGRSIYDSTILPDHATAEAVLTLCQLIQLRNAYNGDWVPDWKDGKQTKFVISFANNVIGSQYFAYSNSEILYFKTKELRDEFLKYFRPLIEKLKPLYGIKEGGEEC